jgi:hypothetical protein
MSRQRERPAREGENPQAPAKLRAWLAPKYIELGLGNAPRPNFKAITPSD